MIFSEGTTDDLDDTTLTAEKEYLINFPEKKINSCIFVNAVEIYKFKGKDSEGNAALLWLGNLSKDFSHVMIKKTELYWYIYGFSVDYDNIDVDDILDIQKHLMKKHGLKWCLH